MNVPSMHACLDKAELLSQFMSMGRLHFTEPQVMEMKKSQQEWAGCPLWTWQAQRGPTGQAMLEPD